jgi:regulator of ribonuclease activity A
VLFFSGGFSSGDAHAPLEKTRSTSRQHRENASRALVLRQRKPAANVFGILPRKRIFHWKNTLMTHPITHDEKDFNTCDLCDAYEKDEPSVVQPLPPVFRDFGSVARFCGPVATVKCHEDNTRVKEAVESPGGGRVLVVDGGESLRCSLVGGNLAVAAKKHGWAGIVVNGAVRDLAELKEAAIGIRALALMPRRSIKHNEGRRDVPVEIQGVAVRPGDWLYADADGIVVSVRQLL